MRWPRPQRLPPRRAGTGGGRRPGHGERVWLAGPTGTGVASLPLGSLAAPWLRNGALRLTGDVPGRGGRGSPQPGSPRLGATAAGRRSRGDIMTESPMPHRGSGPDDRLRIHPGARAGGLPRGSFGDRGGKVRAWSHPLPGGSHVPSPAPAWLQLPPPARRRTAALCLGPCWASPGASQLPSRLVPRGRRGRDGAHAGGFADHQPKPDAAQSTRENPTFGPATALLRPRCSAAPACPRPQPAFP